MNNVIGFIELGGIVLAWNIFWNFLIKQFTAHYSNSNAMSGLAAVAVA